MQTPPDRNGSEADHKIQNGIPAGDAAEYKKEDFIL